MKKLFFITLAILSLGFTTAKADNDRVISKEKLPAKTQKFISTHFAGMKISYVKEERDLFRLLISVSGVGGNTARMIQSTYSPSELRYIIATGNATLLKNVKGLGLKTAQKIIVDLSGKMLDLPSHNAAANALVAAQHPEAYDEALAALVMLGFAKAASEKVLQKVFKANPSLSVEDAIRTALKQL